MHSLHPISRKFSREFSRKIRHNKYAVVSVAYHIIALLIIALAVSAAKAQPALSAAPAQPAISSSATAPANPIANPPADALAMLASEWAAAPVVKGAPYCADAVAENTWLLADGNRILRKFNTRLCRDAEGRTRQEMERNGNRRVFINDVVAKQLWMLNVERRVAHRLPNERFAHEAHRPAADTSAAPADGPLGNKMRNWARRLVGKEPPAGATAASAPVMATGGEPVALGQVQGDARGAAVVGVQRLPGSADSAPMADAIIPGNSPQQWQQRLAARGPGVVSQLGQKDFDGITATGRLTTWTIEAGKIGNDKAIISTSEVWTAPDLRLTLLARLADPRNGESTYKLTNVQRSAAAPELFRVPDGYTVRDGRLSAPPPSSPREPAPNRP